MPRRAGLRLATFRALKPELRATIAAQLDRFAAPLNEGHSVYFAPEGTISPTGYDALGSGRRRVVVRVGELLQGLDTADPRSFVWAASSSRSAASRWSA